MTFGYKLIHGRWGSLALTARLQFAGVRWGSLALTASLQLTTSCEIVERASL
jgi:hypothetical protein